jgi:uncharacterized protein YyaL (SSP411 family)
LLAGLLSCSAPAPHPSPLAGESSPYLKLHASDPVPWVRWSPAALDRAKRENKLIFLSIGYTTCHWCHVMQAESYVDPGIAAQLAQSFVPILVDREESPDVDLAYLAVVQAMQGSAGWPLTVVLTPDLVPLFGASYLPPHDGDRGVARGLSTVLTELSAAWAADPASASASGRRLVERLKTPVAAGGGDLPGRAVIDGFTASVLAKVDSEHGGFGTAPKFPRWWNLLELARAAGAGDASAATALTGALDAMSAGGLEDHLGGGFFRYCVDDAWTRPHFEKELVDQAAAIDVYLAGSRVVPDRKEAWEKEILATTAFLSRELGLRGGGFATGLDADSELDGQEVEGAFYTWTRDEVAPLGVAERWNILDNGPFGGRSLPIPSAGAGDVPEQWRTLRKTRPRPRLDDKEVAGWNAMAAGAFARAGFALGRTELIASGASAMEAVVRDLRRPDGSISRTPGGSLGLLDDHELVVQAALDLWNATGEARWLALAEETQAAADRLFAADGGGWWRESADHWQPFGPARPIDDGPEPSAYALGIENLQRLAALSAAVETSDRARAALAAVGAELRSAGPNRAELVAALDDVLTPPLEIVLAVPTGGDADEMLDVVRQSWLPSYVLVRQPEGSAPVVPIAADKVPRGGVTTAYVCTFGRCDAPTGDPTALSRRLGARPSGAESSGR